MAAQQGGLLMKRLVLLFAAAAMLLPFEAQAQEGGYWSRRLVGYDREGQPRYARVWCRSDGYCYRPRRYVTTTTTYTRRDPTRVYSYVRRDADDDDRGGHCREIRRAVGDQHLTVDGAKKAANDSWAGTVRFHLGEKYMDLANARRIVYTCSRSSIKEGGVTTLGQTLTRCEIEAVPCHPPRQMEANDK
jgi:hypothetical protein